ncbi:MAG: hypothetical protein DDG60_08405 [Anaerolineae bacterium]|nr:MAG: hypothetical protein DDG60_08405 [Anaerolineae bacterium]
MHFLHHLCLVILDIMQPEKFSRYEIIRELGRGGMATVYLAYDPLFEREVALKLLKRELLDDPQVRERFERETKIIAKLEHPAIVPVHDVGKDNDQMFYVMRYMTGGSLSDRMSNHLSLEESVRIIQRIASALDYAHARGVIHRDLKPGNILFDDDGNAFISDFGIAKLASGQTRLTSSGIIGTPSYMSPEQAVGENVDGRSDIYSLGIILFEMLSGKLPYEATTPLAMVIKHTNEPIPHILDINPNLPAGIEDILEKAMAKNRTLRYATASAMVADLVKLLPENNPPTTEYTVPVRRRVSTQASTVAVADDEHKVTLRPWLVGSLLLMVIVLALAGWQWLTARSVPPPLPTLTLTVAVTQPVIAPSASIPQEATSPTHTAEPSPTVAPTFTSTPVLGVGGADKIALVTNKDIWVMDVNGSNLLQVTNSDQPKFDVQWLPGGKEILYGEGKCIKTVNIETFEIRNLTCLEAANFTGFRISPDARRVALTVQRRVIVIPFDQEALARAKNPFELQTLPEACLDYTGVTAKFALWSADGRKLAVLHQDIRGQTFADMVRVLDISRCKSADPLALDEFPNRNFVPDGYQTYPVIPAYDWDGRDLFLLNTFVRNGGYGDLYLYNTSTGEARLLNPVENTCCYRDARFSPDGTHIVFAFQDFRQGAQSETLLYYIPVDQIGTGARFRPIKLPPLFFPNVREVIMPVLRPAQ